MTDADLELVGFLDGYRRGCFEGWVWFPGKPEHRVEVEVAVNGFILARAIAADYRTDLRAASIGDGRHGFSIPIELDTAQSGPVKVVVRTTDGRSLTHGEIMVGDMPPSDPAEAEAFRAFIASVLGTPVGAARQDENPDAPPPMNFIVHTATSADALSVSLGVPEYSYTFVLNAFVPLLREFGTVHIVADPIKDVDLLYKAHLSRGENCLFLSFAPPHKTAMGLLCPTIPIIAWEFPTIPSAVWDGDVRHDWRRVLRHTGRAITLSQFAADAVKSAMGADFPVIAIPAPVPDRHPKLAALSPRSDVGARTLTVGGIVFDTRAHRFEVEMATPPLPRPVPADTTKAVELAGVVFTSVFAPKDGRKNWTDIVSAFVSAFAETRDATLVLKVVCTDAAVWWAKLHDLLARLPAFACRIIVLQGYLDEDMFVSLIGASNWIVNASTAEGLCLPLLEFMSGSCPAIAPDHTAMADYIAPSNALIVASDEEYCGWPHDPRNELTTTRHRISWSALADTFREGHRVANDDPARYAAMAEAARSAMQAYCADAVVSARLNSFLGLGHAQDAGTPSALIRLSTTP